MNETNLQHLFEKIEYIIGKNEEISRLKNESFNIFSILRKEHEEEKLHSAFLAELLNCKGNHGLGTIFFNLFIKQLIKPHFTVNDSVQVITEKNVNEFGKIDIFIKNKYDEIIIIENKIYATDQPKQLLHYYNYLKKETSKEKSWLLYLTLEGRDATENSVKSEDGMFELESGKNYYPISYRTDIISWLNDCLKETVDFPTVRETIKQYIILLKKLTNQLTDNVMDKEIKNIITQNYHIAKTIEDNVWIVELDATTTFLEEVEKQVKTELGNSWLITLDEDLSKKWTGIKISHKEWDNDIKVMLLGQSKVPWNSSVYGIVADKEIWNRNEIKTKLSIVEILKTGFSESQYCPYYQEIFNMKNRKEREKLFVESKRLEMIDTVSKKLIELSKACEKLLVNIAKNSPQ